MESRLALATVFGVTSASALIQFDSATPGTISAPTPITGLVGGETVQGIDFRPANGQLYAVTDQSRIYTINVSTGAATLVSTASTALTGTAFGVDFNPVPDRLRIVSDADQNLRVNVATGAATVDATLLYDNTTADGDPIDPNAGQNPTVVDAAYTNSFGGATATTLFGIDAGLNTLVIQDPPNAGTLNTVGALGVDVVNVGGFDILTQVGPSNAGFAALSTDGTASGFYTINLTTGAATLVGSIGDVPTLLAGIAVVPEVTNLSVDKVGPATITAGIRVVETITVTNAGPSAASNVVLTEVLPSGIAESGFAQQSGPPATLAFNGTNTFTAAIPVLAAGESAVFLVGIDVPASFPEGSAVTNTASVASDTPDPVPANDIDTATSIIVTSADLTVTKTDTPDPVNPGQNVNYTITVTNDGPSDAQNVVLSDAVPAGTTFVSASIDPGSGGSVMLVGDTIIYTVPTLAAGASVLATLTVNVNPENPGPTISNTIDVVSDTSDPNADNNSDTEVTTVLVADLSVDKAGPLTITAGTRVIETITVTNAGPSAASNVVLTELLPPGIAESGFAQQSGPPATLAFNGTDTFTATIPVLAPGESAVFLVGIDVPASFAEGSTVTNTASVDSDTTDQDATNDSDTATSTIVTSADLQVTKTESLDPVTRGEDLTYTIIVTNAGPSDAQNVALADLIPINTTFVSAVQTSGPAFTLTTPPFGGTGTFEATAGTLAAGATATFLLTVNVNTDSPLPTITNAATVTSDTSDPNADNDSDTEITVIVGLPECEVVTLNVPGDPGTATLEDDADNPGSGVLIVTGTAGNDTIVVEPNPRNRSQIRVVRNHRVIGTFNSSEVQHIVAFGLAGNDKIIVNATLLQPATLFGDEGNDQLFGAKGADGLDGGAGNDKLFGGANSDTLCGGDGNDFVYGQTGDDFASGDVGNDKVWGEAGNDLLLGDDGNDGLYGGTGNDRLFGQAGNDQVFGDAGNDIGVGGDGNDKLYGGSGRDLLIGGDGADTLFGDTHDDILVAGPTAHDETDAALQAILAEWTSTNSYATRVNNIRTGGGANGVFVLNAATVSDDGLIDTLWGDGGLDWFLFGLGDRLRDRAANELVN